MRRWTGKGCFVLLVAWLLATAGGYWWYQARYLQPYQQVGTHAVDPEEAHKDFEAYWKRAHANGGARTKDGRSFTLVHFSLPGCRCSEQSRAHVRDLKETFGENVTLIQARAPTPTQTLPVHSRALLADIPRLWALVPSVPAAALIDDTGNLIYFGPYSSGPSCGTGTNFVDNRLKRLRNQERVEPWINDTALGCFCSVSPDTT